MMLFHQNRISRRTPFGQIWLTMKRSMLIQTCACELIKRTSARARIVLDLNYWTGRVYGLCVYFMTGAPKAQSKVVLEKPGIQPATPGLYPLKEGEINQFYKVRNILMIYLPYFLTAP